MQNDSIEYQKELTSLESEKRMGEVAIKGKQSMMAEMLKGSMGKDMDDVLSGRKSVTMPRKERTKHWLRWLLNRLGIKPENKVQENEESWLNLN